MGKNSITKKVMSDTAEYGAWEHMKTRCYNKKVSDYKNYGGRGIKVCDEWRNSFLAFYKDMGEKPTPKHTLDRIDNDGDYEPGNVRWATRLDQANNRRSNHWLTIGDETLTLSQWSKEIGINYYTLKSRLRRGWSTKKILKQSSRPIT